MGVDTLTDEERWILTSLAEGKTQYALSIALDVAESTVGRKMTRIARKLGTTTHIETVVKFVRATR